MGFIDYRTAFDSINREILWEKLKKKGVKGKLLKMVKGIYKNTENEVITEEGLTERFRTERGVRQGCPMSPTIFNVYIEDLDEVWEKRNEGER